MFLTELCECGKLKQVNRECKFCGLTLHVQPPESTEGVYELPKANAQVGEDELERARR